MLFRLCVCVCSFVFSKIDSWRSNTCCKIVSKCLCYHDHYWNVERKWCRIYEITRAIDSWRLDTDCNGIYATIIVSIRSFVFIELFNCVCTHSVCAVSYFYFHQFLVCIRYVGRRGNSHNIVRVFNFFFSSFLFLLVLVFVFSRLFFLSRSFRLHRLSFLALSQSNPIDQPMARCVYMSFLNFLWYFFFVKFYYYFFLSFDSFAPLS